MNKKILFFLPIFSLFLMGNAIKQDATTVTVGQVETPIYNVEVTWDAMQFTYKERVNYIWNNDNHTYELSDSTYKWNTSTNIININNKSIMPVNIELKYLSVDEKIDGKFDVSKTTIKQNESINTELILDGELSSNNTNYTKVGTINLVIS